MLSTIQKGGMKKKHKNSISSRNMHGKWEEMCEYGNNNNNYM